MRAAKVLPAILLMAMLGVSGAAPAQTGDVQHKGDTKEWGHDHEDGMWGSLPEEKRKLLKSTMEKVHKENGPLKEQQKKLHGELDALMVAPQFDGDAYAKKSAELDEVKAKMKENYRQSFTSILGQFSQEERIELVVMQHMMWHMKHHHMHHHHDGKGGWGHEGAPHGDGGPEPHGDERPE